MNFRMVYGDSARTVYTERCVVYVVYVTIICQNIISFVTFDLNVCCLCGICDRIRMYDRHNSQCEGVTFSFRLPI